MNIGAPLENFP